MNWDPDPGDGLLVTTEESDDGNPENMIDPSYSALENHDSNPEVEDEARSAPECAASPLI